VNIGKGADADKLPRIFYVNWFRRGEDGQFLWPGFGENSRVLKWAIERITGTAAATETAVGYVPTADQLDLEGLDAPLADIEAALTVDPEEWKAEIPLIEEWFEVIGDKLPTPMRDELEALKLRLGM
jgi:phosphoenolpyruvate carboxykinase (GTP)